MRVKGAALTPFDEASFCATSAIMAKNMGSMRENTCTSSKDVVL
jgi:hypothetical protein